MGVAGTEEALRPVLAFLLPVPACSTDTIADGALRMGCALLLSALAHSTEAAAEGAVRLLLTEPARMCRVVVVGCMQAGCCVCGMGEALRPVAD